MRSSSESADSSSPATLTVPLVGVSNPAIRLRSVLFPQPLGPVTVRNSPAGTVRLTRSIAIVWPKVLWMSRTETAGAEGDASSRHGSHLPSGPATYRM